MMMEWYGTENVLGVEQDQLWLYNEPLRINKHINTHLLGTVKNEVEQALELLADGGALGLACRDGELPLEGAVSCLVALGLGCEVIHVDIVPLVYVCVCLFISVCVCMYVYVCV